MGQGIDSAWPSGKSGDTSHWTAVVHASGVASGRGSGNGYKMRVAVCALRSSLWRLHRPCADNT
ncbi:hypothetical protein OAM02_00620 [Verrucomicrobia bacterium]|nr:hypothetical protein [Verrucomicrobiota bacterium]